MGIPVRQRWELSAGLGPDVDWFSADIGSRANVAVKHTIQMMVPTSTVVNLQIVFNSITKVFDLNEGIALNANSAYQFDLVVYPGMTYNIQNKTGSQNVACSISEQHNTDI